MGAAGGEEVGEKAGIIGGMYFIQTYGCQANKNESERQASFYEQQGLRETQDWREARAIFINTCSVRKAADDRVYAFLEAMQEHYFTREIVKDKETGAKKKVYHLRAGMKLPEVILTGCMYRYREKMLAKYPILSKIQEPSSVSFDLPAKRKDKTQAFVQISAGCNSFCTYCVVPYARGRERSRTMEAVMGDVRQAVSEGYQEITLLGQNVNSWGLEKVGIGKRKENFSSYQDFPENSEQYQTYEGVPPFVQLLREVSAIEEVKKIRFLTSNPWDFYEELVEEVGRNKKIDRFLHLPVQSGSDEVLRRMNRGYTAEQYLRLITKLRSIDAEITIGTDIIVGFGNETEAEFLQTVELVKRADFIMAFVAMYSPRPGTVSERIYPDRIPYVEKKRRFEILDKMINKDQLSKRPRIV